MTLQSSIRRLAFALAIPALVGFSACASTDTMRSGASVPASEGTVKATAADNGNTNVAVRVKHLAPPSKVANDATVYVVWIRADGGQHQSVGALTLNDNLEGSLDTVTPHRRFGMMITPEPSAHAATPTNTPVFTTNVDRLE